MLSSGSQPGTTVRYSADYDYTLVSQVHARRSAAFRHVDAVVRRVDAVCHLRIADDVGASKEFARTVVVAFVQVANGIRLPVAS